MGSWAKEHNTAQYKCLKTNLTNIELKTSMILLCIDIAN